MSEENIRRAYHPELVILIVEDQILFGKDIKHALFKHKVVFARSVEEAKQKYEEYIPHMTFLDIDLPDGTGFELLDFIREREPEAYIAMLTGSKVEADVSLSQKKGARGYIIKPFTKSKIEQHLAQYLEFREKQIKFSLQQTEAHRKAELYLAPNMIIT